MRGRTVVAALTVLGALAPATTAHAQAQLGPCTERALRGAQCATVSVPLDYEAPAGTQIALRVATYPATGPRKGTIVFIPGGPGQAAIPSAARFVDAEEDLRDGYDLVFADPRGTGLSSPLRCAAFPDGLMPASAETPEEAAAAVRACGEQLGPARRFYTTYETVLDIERVRQALAIDKIIPLGVSYGGQVAGDYARRYPQHVQALVLDSTSPVEGSDAMAKLPTLAIPRVLRETCFPPGCEALFGDPQQMLAAVAARLSEEPLRGRVVLPTGRTRTGTVDDGDLYSLVRASDADPALRTALPAAIAAAEDGDAAPLLRLMLGTTSSSTTTESDFNDARFVATECAEGRLPWDPASDPATRPALLASALGATPESWAPFSPEAVLRGSSASLCLGWPATPRPPYVPSPQRGPDVPVLVLAGRDDLRTPLEDQRRTAAQYPNATVVAVPNTGHSVLGSDPTGCASRALAAFLAGAPKPVCDNEQLLPLAPPAFTSLGQLPTLDGDLPAKVERTAVAIDLTLRDVSRQLIALITGGSTNAAVTERRLRIGGLRGGRLIVDDDRLRLLGYEIVPGVRLSASSSLETDSLRLTIGGAGATGTAVARGSDDGGGFTAVLDGHRFTYRPNAILG